MKQLFEQQQLTITTIVINSKNFLLTAQYLVLSLGLKIKIMEVDKSGIKKMYLHAASDTQSYALEICLTNDVEAAERFPVMLGAIVEESDDVISKWESNESYIVPTRVGSIDYVLLDHSSSTLQNDGSVVPVCILPKRNSPDTTRKCYYADEVINWLSMIDNVDVDLKLTFDSWLHWITIASKSITQTEEYYRNLGFVIYDVSEDFDCECYQLMTPTNIGIHLVPSYEDAKTTSSVTFSVTVNNEIRQFPVDYKNEKPFSNACPQDAEIRLSNGRFYYDFDFMDINMCNWELHCE